MSAQPRILVFAGSLRAESYNKKLARVAAEAVRESGGEATYLDLREVPLPIYDGDLEAAEGLPENAVRLKELFHAHDGLLISSPEYNSSISAVLKNTIDWVSRPIEGEAPLGAFDGKVAALLSASPGALGGLRGLVTVRSILSNIKVLVLPNQFALSKAHDAFDDSGQLKNAAERTSVQAIAERLMQVTGSLKRG